ncbi:KAT8 regulatory NSL complex subunit 1-like isoform X2 [Crotalus tigris]|uniref:KAT8 regulatory NSL complex subunit 1-like isoform X2 n=1 Tax=Crotalus tigris TaxID=88082 RepID=UPI00192F6181|nr:KAT8 regulatory NSL complex subunit 1-like isoform X2 [Crotalus tigris]
MRAAARGLPGIVPRAQPGHGESRPALRGNFGATAMAAAEAAEAKLRRGRAAARARQAALWSRARSLCRRLRALQARQVERHVRQQLGGLGGRTSPTPRPGRSGGPELRRLAAGASARLRAAQRGCDSDATESASSAASSSASAASSSASSSSGSSLGNSSSSSSASSSSDSEAPQPGARPQRSSRVGRRLAQRQWALERAAIICRWTWLQAQVLDLEYRIRQQTDVYKQLRANKGPVILGNLQPDDGLKPTGRLGAPPATLMNSRRNPALPPSSPHLKVAPGGVSPCIPSYLLQNADKQNSHLAQSLRNLVCQNPSCAPINGSPEPPKTCTTPHQVNGISNCLSAVTSGGGSPPEGSAPDRHLKRPAPANHSLPAVASALDSSCVAARIRPICRYKKRRLVRIHSVAHLNRKPPKPLSLRCSCEQPNSCVLCEFKASLPALRPDTLSLEERIALLDAGFHPILSFPHGNPLHLHIEALLREDHWPSPKPKPRKPPHGRLKDLTNSVCSPSLAAAPGALLKGLARYRLCAPHLPPRSKPGTSHPGPSLCLENSPGPAASNVPGHPATAGSSALPAKKKKVETSYDINNIVIPMSMAAATRVEKLQYKEILTPSWRTVDPKELVILEEADAQLEDTSDETYLNHHQKFEELERARWDSWTGTSSQRRGNRSSNKADGRWVPPPGYQESGLNSLHYPPGANSPTASLSPDPSSVPTPLLFRGRGGNSFSEDSSFSADEIQNVPPWEPRTFPLSDAEHRALREPSHKTFGQQWDEALRTNHLDDAGLLAKRPAPPEDGDRQRPAEPFAPPALNNR